MSTGGPAGHPDPARVTAERWQFLRQKIEPLVDFGDDLIERRIRRQRVANHGDIDAMRHRATGKYRENLLGPHLPVTAVNEQQRRPFFSSLEKVDPIALARAISEVEVIGILRPHLRGTPFPARDHVAAASHGYAVLEAEVANLQ